MISILGVPYDENSSFLSGCAAGPEAIRQAFRSPSTNTSAENELELSDHPRICDQGDLRLTKGENARRQIESAVGNLISSHRRVLSLGGDHAITFPILRSFAGEFGKINVLQLDAHPDLYTELDGNRYSHACPFARAHDEGLIARHLQAGIRTMNALQRKQADRFAVEIVSMRDWGSSLALGFDGPLYVTLDLDVLDPAFAPGISHYEPGGATVRQVLQLIQDLDAQIIGADIVELNPTRDINGQTAMVAAKFMKEILAKMIQADSQGSS